MSNSLQRPMIRLHWPSNLEVLLFISVRPSLPRFLSSTHACSTLVSSIFSSPIWISSNKELDEALQNWRELGLSSSEKAENCRIQRTWNNIISKATFDSFFIQSDQFPRCRLLSARAKYSGDQIDATPSLLSLDELRASILFPEW